MRDVTAPASILSHSKLAEFPTSAVSAFQLQSCLFSSFIDFGQRREKWRGVVDL
jgi:hypothetical protein